MQEIVFLKPFAKFNKGDKIEANEMRANYFIRMGVAKLHKPKPKKEKQKDTDKSKEKSNDKSGTTNKSKGKS